MASNTTSADAPEGWQSLERFSFGDSPAMADKLLALVRAGAKRATCWDARDGPLTEVGKRMVVTDGAGVPRAVLETRELVQMRFCDVQWAFAAAEGEGDRDLAEWRAGHRRYFVRHHGFDPEMSLWCEHFELIAIL